MSTKLSLETLPVDITSTTRLVGLFGWPVSHSISPIMHNVAFAQKRMNWRYVPLPVHPDRLADGVRGLSAMGFVGANVTVPHKQAVMPYLDQWSPAAEAIGAVNTILVEEDGTLSGDNTDAAGFVADLRAAEVDPAGLDVLILGAGGSARAVVYGLGQAGVASITVANRTQANARRLIEGLSEHFSHLSLSVVGLPDGLAQVAESADLIVNCTSLGMAPRIEGLPWDEDIEFQSDQIVYDLVYNPAMTRLLQLAAADGARTIGGLGMLVHQGAIAWELWTGESAPIEAMSRAADIMFDR